MAENCDVENNNTNQQKAYIWINSAMGALPGSGDIQPTVAPAVVSVGSNASNALYSVDLGMAQMKKYSKYSIRLAQFQMEANNTVAAPGAAAYTELRDRYGKRTTALMIVIKGLPRDLNTVCQNYAVQPVVALGQAPRIRQDAVENIFALVDAGGIANGYCGVERPRVPQFVVTKQIFGPLQLRVEIRDAGSTQLVSGGYNAASNIGFREIPPFNICLEVEGLAGYEEFQPDLYNENLLSFFGKHLLDH